MQNRVRPIEFGKKAILVPPPLVIPMLKNTNTRENTEKWSFVSEDLAEISLYIKLIPTKLLNWIIYTHQISNIALDCVKTFKI